MVGIDDRMVSCNCYIRGMEKCLPDRYLVDLSTLVASSIRKIEVRNNQFLIWVTLFCM